MEPLVLSVEEVASMLKCEPNTVMEQWQHLGGAKFGRTPVFPVDSLRQRLTERGLASTPAPPQPAAVLVPVKKRAGPPVLPTMWNES